MNFGWIATRNQSVFDQFHFLQLVAILFKMDPINLVFLDDTDYQKMVAAWITVKSQKPNIKLWAKTAGISIHLAEDISYVLLKNGICTDDGVDTVAYAYVHQQISSKLNK
jgi:hypothetical protein